MAAILMVDDQPYFKALLEDELAEEGHSISTICNAEEVTEHLNGSPVDVVLLDLFLDEVKGWTVLDSIKAQKPSLPVVILTAYDNYREDPRLSKASAYVIKNADLRELKWTIAQVLEQDLPKQAQM